jgi:hypothetical protein
MVVVSQGAGGKTGSVLRKHLAEEGKKLPVLEEYIYENSNQQTCPPTPSLPVGRQGFGRQR